MSFIFKGVLHKFEVDYSNLISYVIVFNVLLEFDSLGFIFLLDFSYKIEAD